MHEDPDHDHRMVPSGAPGPPLEDDIDIRQREPLYADEQVVREEYAIITNMNANDEWLTVQRRERLHFGGDRELAVDLEEWR